MSIVIDQLTKRYEQQAVVNRVQLTINDGEFFVLLGPSGSGKSTLLRMLAGLISNDEGRVLLHGRDVTKLPPQARDVGFVFQNYALFEHMNVGDNIEFALKIRKVSAAERQRRRDTLLDMVGLAGLAKRLPRQLSGGQQQRVALARALAHNPAVLLLDEPFGALDAKIRSELRRNLRGIQRELGITAIFVTHDQDEAFELADRIGVMNHGRLLEVGTPSELYQRPQTDFVATFLGSANVMLGTCDERGMYVGDLFFPLKTAAEERRQNVHVMFRPEDVVLAPSDAMLTIPSFGIATIEQRTFAGSFERLRLRIPAQTVVRSIAPPRPFGDPDILLDAQRPIEASYHMPLTTGDQVQIGVQRIHALAQRGLNVLIASESSRSAAVATGTMLIRQAHGRGTVVLYNTGFEQPDLQPLREQLGVGMTSLALRTSSDELAETLQREIEHLPYDLLVLDAGSQINERARIALASGEHHVLLVSKPVTSFDRALVCVAEGEPAKEDVAFAGRFLHELGGVATVLSVAWNDDIDTDHLEQFVHACVQSLNLLAVPATGHVRHGIVVDEIERELKTNAYDLLVIGATLPKQKQAISLSNVVQRLLQNQINVPILIVRSSYVQPFNERLRVEQMRLKG